MKELTRIVFKKLVILLIWLILLLQTNIYAWCGFEGRSSSDDDGDYEDTPPAIVYYLRGSKEISAARVTLANGTILFDIQTTKDTSKGGRIVNQSFKEFKMIFIVDTSEGMEDKLEYTKQAIKNFAQKVYSIYNMAPSKLKIGVIGFDNYGDGGNRSYFLGSKTQSAFINEVNSLQIGNSRRSLSQAAELAFNNLTSYAEGENENRIQAICVITDGQNQEDISVYSDANTVLIDASENTMAVTSGLILGTNKKESPHLGTLFKYIPSSYVSENVTSLTASQSLSTSLYDKLSPLFIAYSRILPAITYGTTKNVMLVAEEIMFYLDLELLHGALLEIEYKFTTESNADTITITERSVPGFETGFDDRLKFSRTAKLLTDSSKTNSSYGWTADNNGDIITSAPPGESKLVLSTVISRETLPEDPYYNMVTYSSPLVGYTVTAESNKLNLLPPFGEEEKISYNKSIILGGVFTMQIIILISLYIKAKIKKYS